MPGCYVPAESPYVFAAAAPLPDDVRDKLGASNREMLESYRTIITNALDHENDDGDAAPDPEQRARIKAVIERAPARTAPSPRPASTAALPRRSTASACFRSCASP